jgi:uncharacterized membrane protein HdeD (DUF308 family)
MTNAANYRIAGMLTDEVNSARRSWDWFLVLGVVQIMAGALTAGLAFAATPASVMTLGVLFLIAAGAQVIAALLARDWGAFILFLLLGALDAALGLMTLRNSLSPPEGLNLMLAAGYPVGGVFRIVIAAVERFPSWGWVRMNGAVTLLLGLALCGQRSESGLWALGILMGIDFVVNGAIWAVLALGVHVPARL